MKEQKKARQKTRAERSVVTLRAWDMGATGPANRAGLVLEEASETDPQTGRKANPNGVLRARRVDMLEHYHRKGQISTAGLNAAEALRDAFEATQRAPGWPESERVDASPKPDQAVAMQIDRISRFHAVNRLVPQADRELIDMCVLRSGTPGTLSQYRGRRYHEGIKVLAAALDRLAGAMSGGRQ
jgi:hypothetical protein